TWRRMIQPLGGGRAGRRTDRDNAEDDDGACDGHGCVELTFWRSAAISLDRLSARAPRAPSTTSIGERPMSSTRSVFAPFASRYFTTSVRPLSAARKSVV